MKTIGYITSNNPFKDKKAWSGTIFKIREAIEMAGFKIVWIPYKTEGRKFNLLNRIIRLFNGENSICCHNKYFFKLCYNSIDKKLIEQCDYLFFPGGAQISTFLKTDKPIIYYTDCSFKSMINYYWFNLSKWVINQGNRMEYEAIHNSQINIRSSQWAIDSVIKDYNGDPHKTYLLEFGANIDDKDILFTNIYSGGKLNIFFSGVEWERKGCKTAIETVKELNRIGIESKLFLVGIPFKDIPTEYQNIPYIEYLGFLNKNSEYEYNKYISIIKQSHIFLLPTIAECAGIVFCEASAYGLPIFTYNTGGVGSYVIDGINGYKLKLGSCHTDFASKIAECINNKELTKLSIGGKRLYNERFNWNSWAEKFRKIIEDNLK